ncbi:MAG: hypothetical protein LBG15_15990 [Dysgonamonadaceae bacterium]|jgi:hypothetical protein|nr:hypothetical protein [Dysgonamonadaceae bacterium]
MKRAISVFLLLIMSLVAAQPTIAFHYCGNHLQSVEINGMNAQTSCCGKKSCCSNYTVQMTTDHFQLPQHVAISVEIQTLLLKPVLFLSFDNPLMREIKFNSFLLIQTLFPPGGFVKYNVDLLTLICVFRN